MSSHYNISSPSVGSQKAEREIVCWFHDREVSTKQPIKLGAPVLEKKGSFPITAGMFTFEVEIRFQLSFLLIYITSSSIEYSIFIATECILV